MDSFSYLGYQSTDCVYDQSYCLMSLVPEAIQAVEWATFESASD